MPSTVQEQLPSLYVMKRFVDNLIGTYNDLVTQNDKPREDFDQIQGYFTLYRPNGTSFNVTVMQSEFYSTGMITLFFTPIQAAQPNVTIDRKDTFRALFPHAGIWYGFDYSLQKNFSGINYNGDVVRIYLILEVPLSDFT